MVNLKYSINSPWEYLKNDVSYSYQRRREELFLRDYFRGSPFKQGHFLGKRAPQKSIVQSILKEAPTWYLKMLILGVLQFYMIEKNYFECFQLIRKMQWTFLATISKVKDVMSFSQGAPAGAPARLMWGFSPTLKGHISKTIVDRHFIFGI